MNRMFICGALSCLFVLEAVAAEKTASQPTERGETVRQLRERADRRIAEIRAEPNRAVPSSAPRRYLSAAKGDDAADGLTPQTAWRTVARLNRETLPPGTFVLFERGGVYRGSVKATTGVTLTAYGSGEKPRLYASPENGADPKKWVRTENPKVWAYDIGHDDVGTLVFDGGAAHAVKILLKTDPKTGKKSDLRTWRPFDSYRDIAGDLHFWHDYYAKGTGKVYLVSDRNPGERFSSIEFNVCKHGVAIAGDDVTVDNLSIAYVGAHGVGAGSCRNLTVKNCEFAWIGGSILSETFAGHPFPTRFGNAVEIWGSCDGYVVSNCYVRQVYDAGLTHQFDISPDKGLARFDQRNIVYARNVIENCNYSIEYFLMARNGNESLMENVRITDNLMFDAGYGFCEQRPDPWVATHVMAYSAPEKNRAKDFLIKGNVLCGARRTLVEIASSLPAPDGGTSLPRMEDNLLVGKQDGLFGYVADKAVKVLRCDDPASQAALDARGPANRLTGASGVSAEVRTFAVDATAKGGVLPNPSQMLTSWSVPKPVDPALLKDLEWDVRDFAEWVEVMAATGGNAARDCYRNPDDRTVTDDYDFSKLVEGCRNILATGMKPYLKLGNVPMKLSSNISKGDFSINVRPPDDYAAYGRYMEACARALLDAFGRDELLKWRFAVLTEYENKGWFEVASGDAERTFHAYCFLYEKTVEAFSRVISSDLTFGAHAMAVTEGLWDERRFFAFAAERRLPLKFVTASFYDNGPGSVTSGLPLPKTIAHLRAGAVKAGFTNLFYGVDEGRLWGASAGKKRPELALRIVGDTYQAAYDARVVRQLFDSGADYFASWGYMTGPNTCFEGIPSVSFHVAKEAAKFKGLHRIPVVAEGGWKGLESETVAAVDANRSRVLLMAYSFTNDLHAAGTTRMRFSVRLPESWRGKDALLVRRQVDDRVNWFPQWRRDRKAMGLSNDRFSWSPDDPAVLGWQGLVDAKDRAMFRDELLPRYRATARMKAATQTVVCKDEGPLVFDAEVQVNSALFLELTLK